MDFTTLPLVLAFSVVLLGATVSALDPYYIPRARILSRQESEQQQMDRFKPSAVKCRKIGEKAARRRISCVADTNFFATLSNRVHKARLSVHEVPGPTDRTMKELAYKISKCSIATYRRYFEKSCTYKASYYAERRRCSRQHSARDRSRCKGELRKRFTRG